MFTIDNSSIFSLRCWIGYVSLPLHILPTLYVLGRSPTATYHLYSCPLMKWSSCLSLLTISPDRLSPLAKPCPYPHASRACTVKTFPTCLVSKVPHLCLGLSSTSEPQMRADQPWGTGGVSFSKLGPMFLLVWLALAATPPCWLTLLRRWPKPPGLFLRNCLSSGGLGHPSPWHVQFIS